MCCVGPDIWLFLLWSCGFMVYRVAVDVLYKCMYLRLQGAWKAAAFRDSSVVKCVVFWIPVILIVVVWVEIL